MLQICDSFIQELLKLSVVKREPQKYVLSVHLHMTNVKYMTNLEGRLSKELVTMIPTEGKG
jgi:hypothetical protein